MYNMQDRIGIYRLLIFIFTFIDKIGTALGKRLQQRRRLIRIRILWRLWIVTATSSPSGIVLYKNILESF